MQMMKLSVSTVAKYKYTYRLTLVCPIHNVFHIPSADVIRTKAEWNRRGRDWGCVQMVECQIGAVAVGEVQTGISL